MLKTLPSILTAPAQAATAALSGKAVRLDLEAGAGFARLMQQQADLRQSDLRQSDLRQSDQRQSDQRLAQQRQAAGRSPEPRPMAPVPAAQARPTESRPASADGNATAMPLSAAANPTPSSAYADKPGAAGSQNGAAPHTTTARAAGTETADIADSAGSAQAGSNSAGSRSAAGLRVNANAARARHAALAGWRPTSADGAAVPARDRPPGPALSDRAVTLDPIDTRSFGGPVPAPDSNLAAALPNTANVPPPAADPLAAGLLPGGGPGAAASAAALSAEAADWARTVPAGAANGLSPRAASTESTAGWVAAQQRQYDPNGSAAGDRAGVPVADRSATGLGDASLRPRRSAAGGTTAEPAPTDGAAKPADTAALEAGDIAAAPANTALRVSRGATQPDLSAAGPDPSTQADAVRTAAAAQPRPDATLASGVLAGQGATLGTESPAGTPGAGEAAGPVDATGLTGATRPDSTDAQAGSRTSTPQAGSHYPGAADGTAGTRRTPGTPSETAPGPTADAVAQQTEGKAAGANMPTPAQAAGGLAESGADIPGGPRRNAAADHTAATPGDGIGPDAAGRDSADRDTHRLDRLGSATARPDSPVRTGATLQAPNAASALQTTAGAGADAQPSANGGDSAAAAPAVAGIATAQSATSTVSLANTPAAAATVEARIAVPVDSPAFAPALGAQVSLLTQNGVQTARLQLNPAEMGPITVQIALEGNTARVDFQADRAATRDLIEASLPTLAGAMQDAGLTLTGGGVFQQHPGRQSAPEHSATAHAPRSLTRDNSPDSGAADPAFAGRRGTPRGLVDLVA